MPYPNGLFWTVRIPRESVEVELGEGSATLRVVNQHVRDFFSIPNALANGESVGATVSYEIHWHGVKRRHHVRNETLHVAGLFLETDATIAWSARNATGFAFASEDEEQKVISAQIGHERNGVFFD